MSGTRFSLEVQPRLPARLARLEELANDLYYSWDKSVRGLFFRLDRELWETAGHNPKVFLRRVAQDKLDAAANDRVYTQEYNRVLSAYDTYLQDPYHPAVESVLDPDGDLIAYSCFEFGMHESFPLYSGGLGILAGDHCKAASDMGIPFVAIGLLYRHGYFRQEIDGQGRQIASYVFNHYGDLPVRPAHSTEGVEVVVTVNIAGRAVDLKVWEAKCGHIRLYLLDTDTPSNSEDDRRISYQLYGGDSTTRIQQEIVLGVGGARAMRALGLKPTVWHINEGHAAFQILERTRERVASGLDFASSFEAVAAETVFTTHTPVPAGHDVFEHDMMHAYFGDFAGELGLPIEDFLALGAVPGKPHAFNMTALGLRGSRFRNGVSRIHGGVVSDMESYIWPDIPPEENPISYVTNGVHLPTFLTNEWSNQFDQRFGSGWRNQLLEPEYWERIDEIPDHSFWSICQSLKAKLFEDARRRLVLQLFRNGTNDSQVERMTRFLNPAETGVLTVGFARRFATYKRATLIFDNPDRLARLLNDPKRPMIIFFAGKAHPNDEPGQALIRHVHDFSRQPQFEGKIIVLENYDMSMARRLLPGVDVWLNTPEYPLEASGTSGQKAGVNGALNLSVLDGWWGEGYTGDNGFAITPHGPQYDVGARRHDEALQLLDLLEHRVIPAYFEHSGKGYSEEWVRMAKASMKTTIPRFNSLRMLWDYVRDFYAPAAAQARRLSADGCAPARTLATWRAKVQADWPRVSIRRLDDAPEHVRPDEVLPIQVAVSTGELDASDIVVECLVGTESDHGAFETVLSHEFEYVGPGDAGEAVYRLAFQPTLPGLQCYKIRAFPYHALLSHRFEAGCMLWL